MRVYLALGLILLAVLFAGKQVRERDKPRPLAVWPDGSALLEDGTKTPPGYADWQRWNGE